MEISANNDSTLSKLGDIYQYYRALLNCFGLEKGDILTIEVHGDVSILSLKKENSVQKEIKHHIGDKQLNDRHTDFWKTLKNWITDKKNSDQFAKLEFYTTSEIPETCKFYDWNERKDTERLEILERIGKETKAREKEFRIYYEAIFNPLLIKKEEVLEVVKKITIMSKEKQIQELEPEFDKYISKYIPKNNRKAYIDSMLGLLVGRISKPPYKWIISIEEFDEMSRNCVKSYIDDGKIPLPLTYSKSEPSVDIITSYNEKRFVKEIIRIDLEGEVPYAISDYWKMGKTYGRYFFNNPTLNFGLTNYRDNLKRDLDGEIRKRRRINLRNADENKVLIESQSFYFDIINQVPEDFYNVIQNQKFFRCGVIHDIVNENEFDWYLGGQNEH